MIWRWGCLGSEIHGSVKLAPEKTLDKIIQEGIAYCDIILQQCAFGKLKKKRKKVPLSNGAMVGIQLTITLILKKRKLKATTFTFKNVSGSDQTVWSKSLYQVPIKQ